MTTHDRYRKLLERIGAIDAELEARENEPVLNVELLTPAERAAFDRIEALAIAASEDGLDSITALGTLTYEQLCELRAMQRKACGQLTNTSPSNPLDIRDSEILAAINHTAAA